MTNPTKIEKSRAVRAAAMLEVKRLVKKYGRAAVGYCLIVDRWREKETTGEVVGRIVAKLETAIAALMEKP